MKKEQSQIATFTKSRAFKTFLPFLFLSYIIWSLSSFAETQADAIPVKISYKNSPQNKLLINKPNDYLQVEVEASGFNILRNKLLKKELIIDLNQAISKSDTLSYIQTTQFLSKIQAKLPNDMKVLRVNPDTLIFKYKALVKKEVPIHLKQKISYQKGFSITDSILIKPRKTAIFGTKNQLDKIKFIETQTLELENINQNIFEKIALTSKDSIRYAIDSVQIVATVDQLITGSISLPFQLKHISKDKISTFPNKITIVYKAPLEIYKNLKPSDFSIVCDYNKRKNNVLIPEISKKPSLLKITDIKPKVVQFLIK